MIITRAPYRISFFGGGTDYPVWFEKYGGSVLSTTIDKYCYVTLRNLPPFFEHKHRIVWSKTELVKDYTEIEHPMVREALRYINLPQGLEIHHDGDVPAKSGLGTSSSFTVALLHALYALMGRMPSKLQLAKEAIIIEQQILKENVGCQDQMAAAFGGLNRFNFHQNGLTEVVPITINKVRIRELESHLMMFFTGFPRNASEVASEQIAQSHNHTVELNEMKDLVQQAVFVLKSDTSLIEFGKLLDRTWQLKRRLSNGISNERIDAIYEKALRAGASGGKLLGAGGGGFILFFVRPDYRNKLKKELKLLQVPFHFENSGSQVVFYDPD